MCKLIVKAEEGMEKDAADNVVAKITFVKAKNKLVDGMNEKIPALIDEKDIDGDVDACRIFEEATISDVLMLEKFIEGKEKEKTVRPVVSGKESVVSIQKDRKPKTGIALPKMQIKKFTSDPTMWVKFHDCR